MGHPRQMQGTSRANSTTDWPPLTATVYSLGPSSTVDDREKKKKKFQQTVSNCLSITRSLATRLFPLPSLPQYPPLRSKVKNNSFLFPLLRIPRAKINPRIILRMTRICKGGLNSKKKKERERKGKRKRLHSMTPTFLDIRITAASGILSLKV